jgi:hypothetical protein
MSVVSAVAIAGAIIANAALATLAVATRFAHLFICVPHPVK